MRMFGASKSDNTMRKVAILKHKIIRAYHNPDNWNYSEIKGYPKGTYFGYDSLEETIKLTVKRFVDYYGKGLRKWNFN